MTGTVNDRHEATLPLTLRGPDGDPFSATAVIDTGFSSALTLPDAIIAALGLVRESGGVAMLADGTQCEFDVYAAEVWWMDAWRQIMVSAVGEQPLLGMRMLAGHKLVVDVVPGGAVEIMPLP
jgi:clan AA aspartic protease